VNNRRDNALKSSPSVKRQEIKEECDWKRELNFAACDKSFADGEVTAEGGTLSQKNAANRILGIYDSCILAGILGHPKKESGT
jgi:hypothetical protein